LQKKCEEKKEDIGGEEEKPNVTVKIMANAFPMRLFTEWDSDCKERFGDCRWMKMWNDHLASKNIEMYLEMSKQILDLRIELEEIKAKLKKPVKESKEEINVLGEEENEDGEDK
jgi:hypothetical protein